MPSMLQNTPVPQQRFDGLGQQSVSRLNYSVHKVERGEERPQTDHRGAMFAARVSWRGWQGRRARLEIVGQVDVPDRPQEN